MATRTQKFNGLTAGTTPTSANTQNAGDTASPATVAPGTGTATVVGTTTPSEVIEGTASVKGSYTGNGSGFTSTTRPSTVTVGGVGYWIRLPVMPPTANVPIDVIRNTGGKSCSASILTNGKIKWSTASADVFTVPTALTAGDYWITQTVDTGTSAANDGRMAFAIYNSSGALAGGMVSGDTGTRSGLTAVGAGAFLSADQVGGKLDASTTLTSAWVAEWDGIVSTDVFGLIPFPTVTTSPPTITPGAVQNLTGTTGSISFTATDTGTVESFAVPTLASNTMSTTPTLGTATYSNLHTTTATVSYPVSNMSAGTAKWTTTATDNSSTTSAVSAPAQINVTADTPAVIGITAPTYTVVGGGTALQAMQAGLPNSRYLLSPAPPAGGRFSTALNPATASAGLRNFGYPNLKNTDTTTTINVTIYLMEGATIRAQRGPFPLTNTYAPYGGTTTSGEEAAIVDRSALTVDFTAS